MADNKKTKTINFKIDEDLYKSLKLILVEKDLTIKDFITSLIQKSIQEEEQK